MNNKLILEIASPLEGGEGRDGSISYKGYVISYNPPPIPVRDFDYVYCHTDYDGPGDPRCGVTSSIEDAKREIDEFELQSIPPAGFIDSMGDQC